MAKRGRTRPVDMTEKTTTDAQTEQTHQANPVELPPRVVVSTTQTTTTTTKTEPIVQSADLQRVTSLLNTYKGLISNIINDDAKRARIVALFIDIVHTTLRTSDSKVFDAVYAFFVQNRSAMLNPAIALGSAHKINDPVQLQRVVAFYTVFSALVESKLMKTPFTLSTPAIRNNLKNKDLVNWLIAKRDVR